MHFQINPTYVIIGVVLIAVGLLTQRFLAKKQPVVVAIEKPLQIGFHVGEEPISDAELAPNDDILEPATKAQKSKGLSFLKGLRGSTKPKATPVEATFEDAISSNPIASEDEPAIHDRTDHIEARVNNVPRIKNPLRFSTKRIVETPPTPQQTDKQEHVTDPIAHDNTETDVEPVESAIVPILPTLAAEDLEIPTDNDHAIPKIELVPAHMPSVSDVTDDMIAHLLRSDPVLATIPTIALKAEPEEDIPVSLTAAERHETVLDDDIPVMLEENVPEHIPEPHTTIDLKDLVIPAASSINDMQEDEDVDVPLHATTIATTDDDDEGPIDFSGGLGINDEERRQLLAEMEEDELAQAALEEEEEERLEEHERTPADELPSVIAMPPKIESEALSPPSMLPTFRWTTFIGEDAQSLGTSERANLVRLLRDMHDAPRCLPALMEAFNEEQPEELRPAVLEAITHSYSNENLRPLYEYCLEYGSEREKELAQKAIDDLG